MEQYKRRTCNKNDGDTSEIEIYNFFILQGWMII